jgi:predicted dehydrogenase
MIPVKLGIIGCGFISDIFCPIFETLKGKINVVATCDIDIGRARQMAKALGAEYAVEHYEELIDKVDAFYMATPHDLHYSMGMKLIKARKHVLMEKPMAITENECLDLIHAGQKSDKVFMIGYIMRYHPLVRKL